jgi:hypothetical protein
MKFSLTKAKERATSACSCRCVSVSRSLLGYSVQYKGYNLVGVTTVEGGTRGTTALVYLQLHITQLIYRHSTCTVQGCWNTSASLTAD